MSIFDDLFNYLLANFSEWIKIEDYKSEWTIEDFPYETGVDERKTNPHCWYCVTINRCWFKNEEGKKPREFLTLDPSSSTLSILLGNSGLYHKYCHCKKEAIDNPTVDKIKLIIPDGKIDWMIKDKGHTLKEMGYKEDEFEMVVAIIGNLVKKEFVKGNYFARLHDKYGYKIGFIINDFPGKNEDQGKFYKIKSGWTIFPNGKLKCNTLVGGLLK